VAEAKFQAALDAMRPADQRASLQSADWDGRDPLQKLSAKERSALYTRCWNEAAKEVG